MREGDLFLRSSLFVTTWSTILVMYKGYRTKTNSIYSKWNEFLVDGFSENNYDNICNKHRENLHEKFGK